MSIPEIDGDRQRPAGIAGSEPGGAKPTRTTMFGIMFKRRRRKAADPETERHPLASRLAVGDDSPTDPVDDEVDAPRRAGADEQESTRGPLARSAAAIGPDAATRIVPPPMEAPGTGRADPPVGILLVIAGPGAGRVLPFGHGMNAIGRGDGQRVRLDFGDDRISRNRHALVTYDAQGRRFYLQHGGGPNLTYLGDHPVLEPVTLEDGDRITLGETTLLFRALVGEDFDWSGDLASAPAP
jgi:hypothetical protein